MKEMRVWNAGDMILKGETAVLGKRPVVMSFSPPQILNGLA
jgi:hypothetical protein